MELLPSIAFVFTKNFRRPAKALPPEVPCATISVTCPDCQGPHRISFWPAALVPCGITRQSGNDGPMAETKRCRQHRQLCNLSTFGRPKTKASFNTTIDNVNPGFINPRLFFRGGTISIANYDCFGEPPQIFSTLDLDDLCDEAAT